MVVLLITSVWCVQERCGESSPVSSLPPAPLTPPFTVYTDIELVRTFLTHPLFEVPPFPPLPPTLDSLTIASGGRGQIQSRYLMEL